MRSVGPLGERKEGGKRREREGGGNVEQGELKFPESRCAELSGLHSGCGEVSLLQV